MSYDKETDSFGYEPNDPIGRAALKKKFFDEESTKGEKETEEEEKVKLTLGEEEFVNEPWKRLRVISHGNPDRISRQTGKTEPSMAEIYVARLQIKYLPTENDFRNLPDSPNAHKHSKEKARRLKQMAKKEENAKKKLEKEREELQRQRELMEMMER